jgi:hypothetical protein
MNKMSDTLKPLATNEALIKRPGIRAKALKNQKVVESACVNNEAMIDLRQEVKMATTKVQEGGIDIMKESDFPVMDSAFSWKKVQRKLREADSASSFDQVLRAGVQSVVNTMYNTTPTTHELWAHAVQSNKDTELYAPLHGISFPREIGRQENYTESHAAGLDIKLKNRKYGTMYPVELELLNDDQTGQFQRQSGYLGEYLKLVLEVLCYAKLASSSSTMQYQDLIIPASETKPSYEANYPYAAAAAPFSGGGYNKPASFGQLSQATLQSAFQAQMVQKNLLGLRMLVEPDLVICGPKYEFDLATILHSNYYPTGATAGAVGGAFSINPLHGIADACVSRFIFRPDTGALDDGTATAWWLADSKKPWFVVQIREGAVVEQEAPNSGKSFEQDIVRFKGRTRANADFIDPRFVFLGDDGSV